MKVQSTLKFASAILISLPMLLGTSVVEGKGNLAEQKPIEVVLKLSEYAFTPNKLDFETGKLYKLVVKNVGKIKHELDSSAISHLAYTRKLQVNDSKGNLVAEIKGSPAEVEVGPNHQIEWWFVPIQTTENDEFVCLLEGHYEAGMKGVLNFY